MISDIYTDVERSLYMHLMEMQTAQGWTYPIFNNMVTKKDFPNSAGAISIIKVSDVPNHGNGGGCGAHLSGVQERNANGDPVAVYLEEWPQFYDVLYQVTVLADYLEDARKLDWLVRRALPPRKNLRVYDSVAQAWSETNLFLTYAGYINRDVPESYQFWRCNNVRVEVPDYKPEQRTIVPTIQKITAGIVLAEATVGNVDVEIVTVPEP